MEILIFLYILSIQVKIFIYTCLTLYFSNYITIRVLLYKHLCIYYNIINKHIVLKFWVGSTTNISWASNRMSSYLHTYLYSLGVMIPHFDLSYFSANLISTLNVKRSFQSYRSLFYIHFIEAVDVRKLVFKLLEKHLSLFLIIPFLHFSYLATFGL